MNQEEFEKKVEMLKAVLTETMASGDVEHEIYDADTAVRLRDQGIDLAVVAAIQNYDPAANPAHFDECYTNLTVRLNQLNTKVDFTKVGAEEPETGAPGL